MCFLRTIRMDRITPAVINYVSSVMTQKFVEPPTFDIRISYADSTKMSPLIFVLSAGSDPVADMLAFAEEMNMIKALESISLGQGQGPKASRLIENARQTGGWVLLCNCHLSISFLPELERICEQMNPDETDNNYRLWLTSMPTAHFPPLLLQNGVKMTIEPPKGLRAFLLDTMSKLDDRTVQSCQKPEAFMRLAFAFCFFHAVCLERSKFGPIGWNIAYDFSMEDLVMTRRQLKIFVDNYAQIPYKALQFLGAAINYGGRVTDDRDNRLINTIITTYICPDTVMKGADHKFSVSGLYFCPPASTQDEFINYLRNLPIQPSPEVFGLHENCGIICSESEALDLLKDIFSMAPCSSGRGGDSNDHSIDETAAELIEQTPELFDLDELEEKFPTKYEESRNTVLKQEAFKYNRLIDVLKAQLPLFRRALKGIVLMTDELEDLGKGLYLNLVPQAWARVGPLSMMPLLSWMKDLNARVSFMHRWREGLMPPIAFWIPGLFIPEAFFTSVLQNFARKHRTAFDRLTFEFVVKDDVKIDGSDIPEQPEAGVYCVGLFLEGGRWDFDTHALGPSKPKQLFAEAPCMHFLPEPDRRPKESGVYHCPIYKVLSRRGTLATDGRHTNFVMYMDMPSLESQDHWIRAGIAAFLALNC
eukprot:gnl/TRDRNA2_/TRDRNA2_171542_c1_seq9.p1 gnl/TRDRNA2_/TRDRNA2_171542_c1~~gnl/TRDRNA2_/TRDRNA2_171542_c1_seq9.p1  ORF type:complete len:647 (+),score=122.52 gnl/TRDRNA2_/TRDRNA2_171542_c1_seq9:121-2061(+)